jgi:hypothetical protein
MPSAQLSQSAPACPARQPAEAFRAPGQPPAAAHRKAVRSDADVAAPGAGSSSGSTYPARSSGRWFPPGQIPHAGQGWQLASAGWSAAAASTGSMLSSKQRSRPAAEALYLSR